MPLTQDVFKVKVFYHVKEETSDIRRYTVEEKQVGRTPLKKVGNHWPTIILSSDYIRIS